VFFFNNNSLNTDHYIDMYIKNIDLLRIV